MSASLSMTFVRKQIFRALDPLLVPLALLIAGVAVKGVTPQGNECLPVLFLVPTTLAVFNLGSGYEVLGSTHLSQWWRQALIGLAGVVGVFLATAYALSISAQFPREVVLGWVLISATMLIGARVAAHRLSARLHRRGVG